MFTPNLAQTLMLAVVYNAKKQGLSITPSTIVSDVFTWTIVQARWNTPPPIRIDIGTLWADWDALAASGLVPPGVVK